MTTDWFHRPCAEVSARHRQRAWQRQRCLTKPEGSLGRIEGLAVELAAMQGRDDPHAARVPVVVFAADHGISTQGVSAYPPEVTVQMLQNFAAGGAAIAVLAREQDLPLHVVDVGSRAAQPIAGVTTDRPRRATRDFCTAPAMDETDLHHALDAGARALDAVAADGADVLILGEMGIGNTTAASAVACALTGLAAGEVTGAGTGLDAARQAHKQSLIERALARHGPAIAAAPIPAMEALRRVGGLEIAALAGAMLAAAQHGTPVLVDGFIVTVAALAAAGIQSGVRDWLLFSHRSAEHGHARILDALQAEPLLQLDLRLGEGSGAALTLPLLRLACALHNRMATFAEAAVSGRDDA